MKNKMTSAITFALFLIIFSGCGQVGKEIAKDQLIGNYKGKVLYVVKLSSFNVGIPDDQKLEDCTLSIEKNDYETYLRFPDCKIGINNIILLINGSSFNIYEQSVTNNENVQISLVGNPIFLDTNGNKSDGQYNSENNTLVFSYKSVVTMELDGSMKNIPMEVHYELKKF